MQTKSSIARIAAALAIAVVLPLAILITMFHSGKKPLAHSALSPAVSASNVSASVTPEEERKITEQYGRLPMSFEPNQGQKNSEVKFYSHDWAVNFSQSGMKSCSSFLWFYTL